MSIISPYGTFLKQSSAKKSNKNIRVEFGLSEETTLKLSNFRIEASNTRATLNNELFVLRQTACRDKAVIEQSMNTLIDQIESMKKLMISRLDNEFCNLKEEIESCLSQVLQNDLD